MRLSGGRDIKAKGLLWDVLLLLSCVCNLSYILRPVIFDDMNLPPSICYPVAIVSLVFGFLRMSEYTVYFRKAIFRVGK